MIKNFNTIFKTAAELKTQDLTDPFNTAALAVHAICNYNPDAPQECIDMLQVLFGEAQPLSNLMISQIRDRMMQNEKWKFIGKSYFVGATNTNDYTPNMPLQIEVVDNPYSYQNEGFAVLYLHSGGADSLRPITLRKMKDGRWVIWSDTIMGILTDIRTPESQNPWA